MLRLRNPHFLAQTCIADDSNDCYYIGFHPFEELVTIRFSLRFKSYNVPNPCYYDNLRLITIGFISKYLELLIGQ